MDSKILICDCPVPRLSKLRLSSRNKMMAADDAQLNVARRMSDDHSPRLQDTDLK